VKDGMDDPSVIADNQITGSGESVPGSEPADSRPNGSGWQVKVKNSDDEPPSLTIDLAPEDSETPTPLLAFLTVLASIQ